MGFSQDFIEKITFLLVTAVLTGFLVPYVLRRIDERKARQGKIIDAQSKFLDDISQALWKWRYLSIRVVYYAAANNREQYVTARKEYDEKIWDIFNQVRREISVSRRLVPESTYQRLLTLYSYMVELDKRISSLISAEEVNGGVADQASELNDYIYSEVTNLIDEMVDLLAAELRLKAKRRMSWF